MTRFARPRNLIGLAVVTLIAAVVVISTERSRAT